MDYCSLKRKALDMLRLLHADIDHYYFFTEADFLLLICGDDLYLIPGELSMKGYSVSK